MSTTNPFAGMFPGFDIMQQAMSGAPIGSLPGLGSWLPTLDPKELDSRINELKTVLFWLEQNAAIVKSTIQALEVQKMTLSTLGAMNVGMAEMAKAFTMPMPAAPMPGAWPFPSSVSGVPPQAGDAAREGGKEGDEGKQAAEGAAPALTPAEQVAASMAAPAQIWWNALNAQFQQLAGNAAQQQAAVEAAAAKTTAQVAEAAAEVAEAAAGMAAAAGQGGGSKPAAKKRAASSKAAEEKDKGK